MSNGHFLSSVTLSDILKSCAEVQPRDSYITCLYILDAHVCSYPRRQALWCCWRDGFSIGPLGCAQLGRHGGWFIDEGQSLWAILRLAVLRTVPLIAICVVVKVCRKRKGDKLHQLAFQHRWKGYTLKYAVNAISSYKFSIRQSAGSVEIQHEIMKVMWDRLYHESCNDLIQYTLVVRRHWQVIIQNSNAVKCRNTSSHAGGI